MKEMLLTSPRTAPKFISLILSFLLAFALFGCNKTVTSGEEMISGTDSKVWVSEQELRADGNKVLGSDHQQTFEFFSDKRFTKTTSKGTEEGTWKYDPARRSITLTYGKDPAMNLQVLALRDNRMRLQVPDGSIMKLQAK